MKFKFYDILAHLVPGFILYLVYLDITGNTFNKETIIPSTAIAFVIGYFINALASWLEGFYHFTWGGKPSDMLLEGKDIWKVRFYDNAKVKSMLKEEVNGNLIKNDVLFSIAMRYATPEVNSRVSDFNANYAFSRVILTTTLIVTSLFIFKYYDSINVYLISIPIVLSAWFRCKQRGYYFAREVLKTFLIQKSKEKH